MGYGDSSLMFFRKKKNDDIILDCYTYNPYAYNFAKINYGYHYIPEWWKKTPKLLEKRIATIKNCPAFVEYYTKGIVLPMWCELIIQIKPKGNEQLFTWKSSHKEFGINHHTQEQFKGFSKEDGHNLKMVSPWYIKCKEEISFTYTQPTWNQRDIIFDLILQPGVLSFKSNMQTNLNYFFQQKNTQQDIHIQPLTPMVIMHPISERKVKLRHHFLTSKEDEALSGINSGMLFDIYPENVHKKNKKLFEKIDEVDGGIYK